MLVRTTHPVNLMLNNVEYLLLKICAHPGKSQRFYRQALENYKSGFSKHHTGESNAMYFRRGGRYRDVLWHDAATREVIDHMSLAWHRYSSGRSLKPKVSAMYLTDKGKARAIRARAKLFNL